jgi:hypothetical protein
MNPLTNSRKSILLAVANAGEITKSKLCHYSRCRGGNIARIPHHLIGLESEGYIEMCMTSNRDHSFSLSKKGIKMARLLEGSSN